MKAFFESVLGVFFCLGCVTVVYIGFLATLWGLVLLLERFG